MKKIIRYCLISSFLLLSSIAESATIIDPSLTIFPNPLITTEDAINAELTGDFPTSGFTLEDDPLVAFAGNIISIDYRFLSPPGPAADVITPFSASADIGKLNTGTYFVYAKLFVDNTWEQSIMEPFTVTAAPVSNVPIPAAAWLFGSSLIALFSLNRRRHFSA